MQHALRGPAARGGNRTRLTSAPATVPCGPSSSHSTGSSPMQSCCSRPTMAGPAVPPCAPGCPAVALSTSGRPHVIAAAHAGGSGSGSSSNSPSSSSSSSGPSMSGASKLILGPSSAGPRASRAAPSLIITGGGSPRQPQVGTQVAAMDVSTSTSQSTKPAAAPAPAPPSYPTPASTSAPARNPYSAPDAMPNLVGLSREAPMLLIGNQRVHSLSEVGREVFRSMEGWAELELPRFLKSVEKSWQPSDYLPDPASKDFYDEVLELRRAGRDLPLDFLVVLVGDMVTEEALPSYMNMLNLLDETQDETGASDSPWAKWTRAWTAEENRHGVLLNRYLYLSGRVDTRAVEVTVQNLISRGLDPKLENNPYLCFVYTSFQERATKISHGNTARLAKYYGDEALGKLCGIIASDEGRHELAYCAIVAELFRRDPDGAMLAFADMMKKGITMPAHFLDDGWHAEANPGHKMFHDYATVADSIGVYTTIDYAEIIDQLVKRWDVANIRVEGGEAAEAQEYLLNHSQRIRRLAELQMERRVRDRKRGKAKSVGFSWIHKKEISLV